MTTLLDLLDASARRHGDAARLEVAGHGVSFEELRAWSHQAAGFYAARGCRPGDRVSLFLPNGPAYVAAYLGALRAAIIVNPLNTRYRATEIRQAIEDYAPRLFVTDAAGLGIAREVLADTATQAVTCASHADLLDEPITHPAKLTADSPAGLFSTSGTTGRAKGALLSHGNFSSNIASVTSSWGWTADDTLAVALPLFHMHGLGVAFHGFLRTGCRLVVRETFDPADMLETIERTGATMHFGVPATYARLLSHCDRTGARLPPLRLYASGSAPLPPETAGRIRTMTGAVPLERYGMTETVMLMGNPLHGERVPGSVGFPFPGVEARITNPETGEILPDGREGEIEVRGPNVFRTYWNRPDATAAAFREGWFRTGDLGLRDAHGRYYLKGRASELLLVGGFNVYPREVEEVLLQHPAVAECAVTGKPHGELGQVPVAFVVTASDVDPAVLTEWCSDRLAGYKVPRDVRFIDALPRNALGKVVKSLLE